MKWESIRLSLCLIGTFLLPFLAITLYLEATRPFPNKGFDELDTDLWFLFGSVTLGAFSILLLPIAKVYRFVLVIPYLPICFYAIAMYWMVYEMARCGVWV